MKSRFGGGYMLEVKLKQTDHTDQSIQKLHNFILAAFPKAQRLEVFGDRAQYQIPQDGIDSLNKTFSVLEEGTVLFVTSSDSYNNSYNSILL